MTIQWTLRKTAYLAATLWAASFFLSLHFFEPAEIERLFVALLGLAGLAILVAAGGHLPARVVVAPRLALLTVLLGFLAVASAAWSVAPPVSLLYLGGFLLLPATILALISARPDIRDDFLKCAAWLCGAVITGISIWALVQVFLLPEFLVSGQVRHPFPNPNAYAALLGLSFFVAVGLYIKADDAMNRHALWVMMFFALCAFAAIAGKAATLGLVIGCILLVLLAGRVFLPSRWKPLLCLAVLVLVVGFIMASLPNRIDSVSAVFGMLTGGTGSIENRIDIWHSALQLVAAHPWLGTGYRTFSLMYPSVQSAEDIYSSGMMVHMDPLQLWVEMGVLGPVLFYLIGLGAAWRFLFWCRESRAFNPRQGVFVLALFLGCGAFIAHSHVDFLLYTQPVMMVFSIAFSLLLLNTDRAENAVQATPFAFMAPWPQGLRLLALFAPVLAVLCLHVPLMIGEYYSGQATRMIAREDMDGFAKAVNTANRVDMGWGARPYMMATTIPIGILKARMPLIPPEEQKALFMQIDSLITNALKRNSRLPAVWYQRGDMLLHLSPGIAPAGYYSAEDCFVKALEISPLHLPSRMALANIYRDAGRSADEYAVLMGGVGWPYPAFDPKELFARAETLAKTQSQPDQREADLARIAEFQTLHMNRVGSAQRWQAARDRAAKALPFAP